MDQTCVHTFQIQKHDDTVERLSDDNNIEIDCRKECIDVTWCQKSNEKTKVYCMLMDRQSKQ